MRPRSSRNHRLIFGLRREALQQRRDRLPAQLRIGDRPDAEKILQEVEHRLERRRLAEGRRARLQNADVAAPAALQKLVANSAFTHAGLANESDDACLAACGTLQSCFKLRDLVNASGQGLQMLACPENAARRRAAQSGDPIDLDRLGQSLGLFEAKRMSIDILS